MVAQIQLHTAAALGSPAGGDAPWWKLFLEWQATQAKTVQKRTKADFTRVSRPIETQHSLPKLSRTRQEEKCCLDMSTYTPKQTRSHICILCVGKIVKQFVFMWEPGYVSLYKLLREICTYVRVTSQPVEVIINTTQLIRSAHKGCLSFFCPQAHRCRQHGPPPSYFATRQNVSESTRFTP